MDVNEAFHQFLQGLRQTGPLEFIGVVSGIISVWFSKKENILVYPTGLLNTIIFIFISAKGHLYGEASVNLYYTIMSFYGWYLWSKKDQRQRPVLVITKSNAKQWMEQLLFFAVFYIGIYLALSYLKKDFAPQAIPWADAFASATAYTGMWLMTRKKLESWYWWIATNIASIPLYFIKGYVFTSVQYLILLILAFMGLLSWIKKLHLQLTENID